MRILLAEGCPVTRALLSEVLAGAGHEVVAVEDGRRALDAVLQLRPAMVLLDWSMPHVDGVEICRRIRACPSLSRGTYVLVVTARDGGGDPRAPLAAGADDFLSTPLDPAHLEARVAIAEQRIRQNAARWAAEARVAEAQFEAGAGEALRSVQHRINNPLASVLAYASMATMEPGLTPELREMLDAIVIDARRIAAVVRGLGTAAALAA